MKHIIKTFGLISLMAAVTGANGAASRVGMVQNSARRIPSVAGWIVSSGTTTTTTNSTASTFSDTECIDAYTGCLKGADVCGPEMEECTTNVLLHAKMPNCLSTLYQCSTGGINSLFGTSSVTALSTVATQNSYGEVTRYTYPTDGSVLGQMVIGAHLSNLLPTDQCVKKYTNCLKRDSVCGADFELCTTNNEFKKQSLNCASTLARCQSEGLIELFGSTNTSGAPTATSRLGVAISEGAALAAVNAVATCYKVADQCILNACGANPTRCIIDSSSVLAEIGEAIASGQVVPEEKLSSVVSTITSRDIAGYLKNACLDTIGGNKYCYATFLGNGQMPTNAQLQDADNREEIFDEAYTARMNNSMKQKIQDLLNKFDTRTKNKCVDTIKSCAMRNCGSGIGSVCYSKVFGTDGVRHINGQKTYGEIQSGCEAVVDTDANCQYAAASASNNMYTYTYTDSSVFSTLFPEYQEGFADPISVVAQLDALLASSYNSAAIANMKKQCQTVALGCVKSMCGKDYTNCYRNRTDIVDGTYDTGNAKLDRSMNKMGGILDYNIVLGLCMNTVKSASICEEHLKIAAADWLENQDLNSWGTGNGSDQYASVREAWRDANTTSVKTLNDGSNDVLIGCAVSVEEAQSKENCSAYDQMAPLNDSCDGVMDEDGCLYTEKIYQSQSEYTITNAAKSLFQELLVDVEKEAQAKYNAKLTKEQNMCLANNNGGVKGMNDNGSTFQWVKLKSGKVPSSYAAKGLSTKQFTTTGDLYGAFCRARITVMSDDKAIQDQLGGDAVAYFAVGDPFTCGSWISQSKLDSISKVVGDRARKEAGEDSKADKWTKKWWEVGGLVAGGLGGFAGMDSIQRNGGTLGGILSPSSNSFTQTKDQKETAENCVKAAESAQNTFYAYAANDQVKVDNYNKAVNSANSALRYARRLDGFSSDSSVKDITFTPATRDTDTSTAAGWIWDETVKGQLREDITALRAVDVTIDNTKYMPCKQGSKCYNKLTELESLLTYGSASATIPQQAGSLWNAALEYCKQNSNGSENASFAAECQAVNTNKKAIVDRLVTPMNTNTGNTTYQMDADFASNVQKLLNFCADKQNPTEKTSGRAWRNAAAGAVGMVAGGMLSHYIVENYYDVKYENAENEAIKQWMNDVGSHIHCYLGSEELGSYGDVISFELD